MRSRLLHLRVRIANETYVRTVADPGVVHWVRSNPVELIQNFQPINFKCLLAAVTSIEGNIDRSVTN